MTKILWWVPSARRHKNWYYGVSMDVWNWCIGEKELLAGCTNVITQVFWLDKQKYASICCWTSFVWSVWVTEWKLAAEWGSVFLCIKQKLFQNPYGGGVNISQMFNDVKWKQHKIIYRNIYAACLLSNISRKQHKSEQNVII